MPDLLHRRLSPLFAYVASAALTGALLLLGAYAQPGAAPHLWLLFGAVASAIGGVLAGVGGTVLSAVLTLGAVDYFALPPGRAFKLPQTPGDVVSIAAFFVTAILLALLAHLKD